MLHDLDIDVCLYSYGWKLKVLEHKTLQESKNNITAPINFSSGIMSENCSIVLYLFWPLYSNLHFLTFDFSTSLLILLFLFNFSSCCTLSALVLCNANLF